MCDFELWRPCASPWLSIRVEFILSLPHEKLALNRCVTSTKTLQKQQNNRRSRECVHLTQPVICFVQTHSDHFARARARRVNIEWMQCVMSRDEGECKRHARNNRCASVCACFLFCFRRLFAHINQAAVAAAHAAWLLNGPTDNGF